jgi:hypothetical protein
LRAPPALRGNRFAAHPRLKLYLVEDLTARLIDSLHQGKLDLVLLALRRDADPAARAAAGTG